jgi:hypothetical protein
MFNKSLRAEIESLESRMVALERRQMDFLVKAHEILKTIMDNDKRKFMYEIRQEEAELINEGRKIKAIRKIVS